ncbi:hypothetical protein BVC80_9099g26 [Macleaya cordata]|uniref:Uncharacterized protein n=1 Tax=Macleaya cordata TaxID=56857 RepID=A0A200PVJ3_MACCD|nr:hypothetical protein BVC80_9099g26 [Macleaya cordata]
MKKNSEFHNKDQQNRIRRSSLRNLNEEVRTSSKGFNSRVSRERADMRRVKRVRFADPDTVPLNCKPDPCSLPAKGTLPPSFDEPKTSEYAFYKRLRKNADRSCHPYPHNKQDNPLEKFEANNSAGELTNVVKPFKHDFGIRSLFPVEKVTPTKLESSHSPPGPGDSWNSECKNGTQAKPGLSTRDTSEQYRCILHLRQESCNHETFPVIQVALETKVPSLTCFVSILRFKIEYSHGNSSFRGVSTFLESCNHENFPVIQVAPETKVPRITDDFVKTSGPHCRNLEVFSTKRQKLLQWALEASSIDSSQCHSNRYDLVSVLFRRLVPESNATASSSCMRQRIRSQELNTMSQLPASPESDILIKELPQTPNMNLISPNVGRYIENGSSECWSNKSREVIFSQLDNMDVDSQLIGHTNNFQLQYQKRNYDDFGYDGRTTGSQIKRELAFDVDQLGTEFSFKGCGYLALPMQSRLDFSIHENLSSSWDDSEKSLGFSNNLSFKELDELHDPNEPVLGEDCSHLLGCDDNNLENENDFASHSLSTVLNLHPISSTSSGDDNWKTLNHKFDETGFHSSSVLAIRHCPDFPLLDFCSESYPVHAFGSQVLEDRDDQVVVSDHFRLNLPFNPNYLALAENSKFSDDYKWRNILHSPRGNWRVMSKVLREISFPRSDTLKLPSGQNFDFRLKGLSVIDSFREHQSSIQSDLQVLMKDMKGPSSSSLAGNINNWCLDNSSHTATHAQFDEDIFNTYESHDYSPIGFKISLNKELVYPFLLDNSSWEGSGEMFLES